MENRGLWRKKRNELEEKAILQGFKAYRKGLPPTLLVKSTGFKTYDVIFAYFRRTLKGKGTPPEWRGISHKQKVVIEILRSIGVDVRIY